MEKEFEMEFEKEVESAEKAEGIKLNDLHTGDKFKILTQNTEYILEKREDGLYLSGNKKYFPTPKKVSITGSTWGGSAIIPGFIGEGMNMEIGSIEGTDFAGESVTTSKIASIEKIN